MNVGFSIYDFYFFTRLNRQFYSDILMKVKFEFHHKGSILEIGS